MRIGEFVTRLQEYHGHRYTDVQKDAIAKWGVRITYGQLDDIYAAILKHWKPTKFEPLPLVVTFEEFLRNYARTEAPPPCAPLALDEKQAVCKYCHGQLDDQGNVLVCQGCKSMLLYIEGSWKWAPSQSALRGRVTRETTA